MKIAEMNRTFLAKSVYGRWRNMIRRATSDIAIFTPYFDRTLITLLRANETVARKKIALVTDISPENALEMPYQLRATKQALSQGIIVLSLQGLHAKILLIDGNHISIGSQNFTKRGQRNKEASVLPTATLGESHLVKQLHEWRSEAREVTEDEIDELIAQLAPLFRKHKQMHQAMHAEFNEILARQAIKKATANRERKALEERKREKDLPLLSEHLLELEGKSPIRHAKRFIYATIRERNGYNTLISSNDLTNWESRNSDGSFSQLNLDWLFFYPIIFADTNRMGFARIAKTRITYVRSGVTWGYDSWMVGDTPAKVSISFPEIGTASQNIVANVAANDYIGSCKFAVSFNGKSAVAKDARFLKGKFATQSIYDEFVLNINQTLLNSKDSLDAFLKKFLAAFPKYDSLDRDRKNVSEYFDYEPWYRISVIQVHGNPLLVFKRH